MPKWLQQHDKQYYIYVLLDPRDDTVRYVGITNNAELRYNQHLDGRSNINVWRWHQEIKKSGVLPILRIIETISRDDNMSFADFMRIVGDKEAYWINKYKSSGASLLNIKGVSHKYPTITKGLNKPLNEKSAKRTEEEKKVVSSLSKSGTMRLEDFRIDVAVLTRQELAGLADVSISSIQRAEEGQRVSRLTQARILKG